MFVVFYRYQRLALGLVRGLVVPAVIVIRQRKNRTRQAAVGKRAFGKTRFTVLVDNFTLLFSIFLPDTKRTFILNN